MILSALLVIFIAHYVADFIIQTHSQSTSKWSDINALTTHIVTYTIFMLGAASLLAWFGMFNWAMVPWWALANGLMHFIVDFITSKYTHSYFEDKEYRKGFQVIGADQLAHQICLLVSFSELANG